MILAIVNFKLHPLDKLIEEHFRNSATSMSASRNAHFDEVEPLECREDLLA